MNGYLKGCFAKTKLNLKKKKFKTPKIFYQKGLTYMRWLVTNKLRYLKICCIIKEVIDSLIEIICKYNINKKLNLDKILCFISNDS